MPTQEPSQLTIFPVRVMDPADYRLYRSQTAVMAAIGAESYED